jgi:hypothetical protein
MSEKALITFEKGIRRDNANVGQPEGSYAEALNAVHMSDDGDMYSLTNERGAELLAVIPSTLTVIGSINLDTDVILFLLNQDDTRFHLAIFDKDNNYIPIFDQVNNPVFDPSNSTQFSFSKEYPVDLQARKLITGDRVVYYTDNNQPFGFFNIDDIIATGTPTSGVSKLIPDAKLVNIEFTGVEDGNGNLKAGSYQLLTRYTTKDGTAINYSIPTDIIPIVDEFNGSSWSRYDGAALDKQTSKSINVTLSNIDTKFTFLEVIAVRYEGGASAFNSFVVDRITIAGRETIDYNFNSVPDEAVTLTNEELRLTPVTYDRAKTIQQKDNRLFLANLRETTADFSEELQEIANRITVKYKINDFNHKNPNSDQEYEDYKNEKVIHDRRTYRRGEVYSFALGVVFKDSSESFAFHIPGNNKLTAYIPGDMSNNRQSAIPSGAGGTLGTYISSATYPPSSTAGIKYPGASAPDYDPIAVDNQVRHHLMPTLSQHAHYNNNGATGIEGDESISLISVYFEFAQGLSDELKAAIQDVYIYRERRNIPQNRSIVSQGIATGIVKTYQAYRDKSWGPKNTDYKGEAYPDSGVYKKAPGFCGVTVSNNVYDNQGVSNLNTDQGFYYEQFGGDTNVHSEICFHSPETQLAEGVFLDEAEVNTAFLKPELRLRGPSDIRFLPSKVIENRGGIFTTRRGFDTFNGMKWFTDFTGWEAISEDEKEIRYSQIIAHGQAVRFRSDDPAKEDLPLENEYSTGFLKISTYIDALNPNKVSCGGGSLATINLNEGKDQEELNINNDNYKSSELTGIDLNGGIYKTNLINLWKKNLQNQYGRVEESEYIPIKSLLNDGDTVDDLDNGYVSSDIYGGDTYITKYAVSNKNVWNRVMPMRNGTNSTFFNGSTGNPGNVYGDDSGAEDYFFDTRSGIDEALFRKGDEYHTLAYFFVESSINTEYRHEIENQDNTEGIPYYPKYGYDEVLEQPPENDDSRGYNVQYSFENTVRTIFTQQTFDEPIVNWANRIIYSDRAEEDDVSDSYRIFSQFDYYDLPKNTGGIWNIFVHNNILYSHTPKSLWMNFVNSMTQQTTDLGQVVLGTGGLFNPVSKEMFTSAGGYAGCISQWGGIHTPFGYIFPDVLQGKIFMLTQTLEEISMQGLTSFFDNNLSIGIKDSYLDNPIKLDRGGIIGVWDNELKRAIMTKRFWDGAEEQGFTYSYNPIAKSWVSEHSYLPNNYIERDNEFFAIKSDNTESNLYQHNRGTYGMFYDGLYPFKLRMILNKHSSVEKSFDNINIHSYCYDGTTFEEFETFKQVRARNDYQDSGLLTINTTNAFDPVLANDEILSRWKKNHFQVTIPRNNQVQLEEVLDEWTRAARMKGKWLDLELTYPNNALADKKLTVNFIEYLFRVIAR